MQKTQAIRAGAIIHTAELLKKLAEHTLATQFDLSYSQLVVLYMLSTKQMTQIEVAQCMEITPAAVSRLVETLERKGALTRISNPKNRRENTVSITKEGQETLDTALSLLQTMDQELFSVISEEEKEQFLITLEKLTKKLETN